MFDVLCVDVNTKNVAIRTMDMKSFFEKYWFAVALVVVLLLHMSLFCWSFSPQHFFKNTMSVNVDTTRYFSSMVSAIGVCVVHGYDPYQMAGYPAGLWNSMGKKGYEIAGMILSGISMERRFYLIVLSVGGLVPILFGAVFMRFFSARSSKLLWGIVLFLFWHFETYISYFWQVGNVFFPAGSLLMAALLIACWKLALGYASWRGVVGIGVGSALLFYVHTVLMVPLAVSAAGFALWSVLAKEWTLQRTKQVCLAGCIFMGLVLPWLIPLLLTRDISVPAPWPMFTGGSKHLVMDFFSDRIYRQHFDRRFLLQAAIVLAMAGSWILLKSQTLARELRALIVGAGVCLVIVYGLPLTGMLGAMQPYRFLIPLLICLLPLTTLGLQGFAQWWWQLEKRSRIWAALPIVILLPNLTAYFVDLTARQSVPSSAQYAVILNEIGQLSGDGRVLIDDIPLGHLAPYYTGKAILGGLSAQAFVAHGFAGIDDRGVLFGRHTQQWTSEELSRYLDLYAVEYLVLQRGELILLAQQDDARFASLGSVGGWQIFRYLPYQGYDVKGDAQVTATYNEIVVERGSSNEVVLKFHFSRFLHSATPGFEIEPFEVAGVPVPFVKGVFADGVEIGVVRQ